MREVDVTHFAERDQMASSRAQAGQTDDEVIDRRPRIGIDRPEELLEFLGDFRDCLFCVSTERLDFFKLVDDALGGLVNFVEHLA